MIAPDDLTLSDDEVLEVLARGVVEPLGLLPRSSNSTFLARVRDDDDELLAVYKPRAGEAPLWDFPDGTLYRREVAAYALAETLGWPRIPPTMARDGPYGIGSLQRFLPFDASEHYFTMQDDPRREAAFRRVALFDVVANNADRKSGHCLLSDDGDLFFIDHGVCFHDEPKLRTVIWDFAGDAVAPDALADLRHLGAQISSGSLRGRLLDLLAREEVAAVERRIEALLVTAAFPEPGPGRPFPWPPV